MEIQMKGPKEKAFDLHDYPSIEMYTSPVRPPARPIVGRDMEMKRLLAAMMRPELCNVILLGEAGVGKSALVQGTSLRDADRYYLEVDLSHMIADLADPNQMADKLKQLFGEVQRFCETQKQQVVLFIDEFHQIVQLSDAAVEALKPLLADSGTRGIRVIAATTYVEFRKWISPNQPLVERLQRINLQQPSEEMVVEILRGMAKRYGVDHQFYDDHLFKLIYEYTNRYIPANAQPRKSILILDSMVGWYRLEQRRINRKLLADVIFESEGVNVAFRVDATSIKKELDKHVYAQEYATSVIEQRLQICVADLNDKSKPMSSFLMTGSSGVGKGIIDDEMIPVYTEDGSVVKKRNGDLVVGDYVFNRKGEPVKVTGVYHRGLKQVYRVTLGDGRQIIVDGSHLWTWKYAKSKINEGWVTTSTEDLIRRGLYYTERSGSKQCRFWIPMNEAVQYSERELSVDPYVVGALLGNGCLTISALTVSSGNRFVPEKIQRLIGSVEIKRNDKNYNWQFVKSYTAGPRGGQRRVYYQASDILTGDAASLIGLKSHEKFIPDDYKYSSVEQRWELIRGLFDTDGSIGSFDGDRFNVSYDTTSKRLAEDIQSVLFSLGIASTIHNHGDRGRAGDVHEIYHLYVKADNMDKCKFFTYPKKYERALAAQSVRKLRMRDFTCVPIRAIEPLEEKMPTTCIMVEDEEHLYQAGSYIVTHNTEVTKQLARILFQDDRSLIRFDMTEFANNDSLDRFRKELTSHVWERPYSIILLDEIEKACAAVTRLLLQVLDDGRLVDENNREVSFVNSYVVLTTNAGSEIYKDIAQYAVDDRGSGRLMKKYEKLIRESISTTTGENKFPPELLGRIDCIVPFQPLSENTLRRIVTKKLQDLILDVRAKHGVELTIQAKVIDYLVLDNMDTDSNAGGARAAISKLEAEVTTAVARYINANPEAKHILVGTTGEGAYENKYKLVSTMRIWVNEYSRFEPVAGASRR